MFTNAKNVKISNSMFIINNTNIIAGPVQHLDRLYDLVAPNAISNIGGRADRPKCHTGTREEVIGLVDQWRLDIESKVTQNQIFWLSGPAGAGKTAIVQTVADKWKSEGIHTANFFFFRTDWSRSHARSLVSTLLYQIFDFYPAAREAVGQILSLKPRILEAGLDEQVDEVICATLRSIQSPPSQPIILLIDGLDECDSGEETSQQELLHALDKLVLQKDMPFLVLVASRAEPQISATFKLLASQARSVFLDDRYSPKEDILLFVTAEFEKIKKTHAHAASLKSNWPSNLEVNNIVSKSSGQFIYAATIMRFLARSTAVPSHSLNKVKGIVPSAKNSPFAHLDAVYTHILHQVDDIKAIHDILLSAMLDKHLIYGTREHVRNCTQPSESLFTTGCIAQNKSGYDCYYHRKDHSVSDYKRRELKNRGIGLGYRERQRCELYGPVITMHSLPPIDEFLQLYDSRYTKEMVTSCISEITSLVHLDSGRLKFYHASFSDFLLDQSRSGQFYLDLKKFVSSMPPQVENLKVGTTDLSEYRDKKFVPLKEKLPSLFLNLQIQQ